MGNDAMRSGHWSLGIDWSLVPGHWSFLGVAAANPRPTDLLPEDPFDFFRWWLGTIATIYATVITLQSLWGWYVWLAGRDKYIGLLRRYLIVHGLRLRFASFWGDVIISGLLTIVFFIPWHAHQVIYDLDRTLKAQRDGARQEQHFEELITQRGLHERHP